MIFSDRQEAGQRLARQLLRLRADVPVVLALPRGGVPVAFEVARVLEAPLDVVLVRKIGAPGQPELAVGAVVDGERPEVVLNEDIVRALGVSREYIDREIARQSGENERRRALYCSGRVRVGLAGRVVIVVDDGIATGATVRAALRAIRRAEPRKLILAVPVAPPDTAADLRSEVDELVCLLRPEQFGSIGRFYADFDQVDDAEVVHLLRRSAAATAPAEGPEGGHDPA